MDYNPDFIVVDSSGVRWVVEVKPDRDATSEEVIGKRAAAERWANRVSSDPAVGDRWRYLLLTEADIAAARGSWPALRSVYTGA